jgi:hypothetical protein
LRAARVLEAKLHLSAGRQTMRHNTYVFPPQPPVPYTAMVG